MKIKILLLVILLALVPQVSATFFINQTSSTGSKTISNLGVTWINQSFTTPNYDNFSVLNLDYIEIYSIGSNAIMFISNDTWSSSPITFHVGGVLDIYRANFSDVHLNKNSLYYYNVSTTGATSIYYDNTNPYSGGRAFSADGALIATDDFSFNISLSPHDNVGNWTFNQGTGVYANDSSPFFNNGTINASGTFWSTNLINGSVNSTSLEFDGIGGNVTVPTNASLNFSASDFTISSWIKTKEITGLQSIMSKYNSNGNQRAWQYFIDAGGDLWFYTTIDGTGASLLEQHTGNVITSLDTWYYVTLVKNGTNADFYVNGVQVSDSGSAISSSVFDSIANVSIGASTGGANHFNGTMDEVKLYNYGLNQSQINTEYQRFQPVPAYPVGGLQINPTEATTYVNFSWHDNLYPQDEIIVATDSGFTNVVHDAFHSTDYANVSLTVGLTYYWKVKQFDSGTGSYGNTSAIQKFVLGTVPTFIRVNVFDELNLSAVPYINVTLVSLATNTSVNKSSTGTNNWVNFTNPDITDGVEYLAQVSAMGYTTRNLLISAPGNYSVYLPYTATSAGISQINFVLSDYTGLFPYQTTKLIVQKVVNKTIINISSNYFDATGVNVVQLINGQQYQLTVESSQGVRSLGSYIPYASATQTLLVGTFSLQPSSAFNGLNYTFTYNSNQSIVLQWNDPNNEIISLNETITNQLNAIVLQLITSVHSGQTTYLIANTSSKYLVQLNISTVHYGYLLYSLWYNPALFTSANASLAPTPGPNNFVIPFGNTTAIGNQSNANAPIPQWVKNFFSVSVLVVMALLFNREHVLRGAVVVSLFSLVFWLTGMLVFDVGYISTGAILGMGFVISIVALLAESNRG